MVGGAHEGANELGAAQCGAKHIERKARLAGGEEREKEKRRKKKMGKKNKKKGKRKEENFRKYMIF